MEKIKIKVQETYGSRGHYYYIVCPVCGTRGKVVYNWEMYDDFGIDDEGREVHLPSPMADTEEKCHECGALLTVVWESDDEKKEMMEKREKIEKEEKEFREERIRKVEELEKKRKERKEIRIKTIINLYGGLPKYNIDGDPIVWGPELNAMYPIVDAELNEEDVEYEMGEGENAPYK